MDGRTDESWKGIFGGSLPALIFQVLPSLIRFTYIFTWPWHLKQPSWRRLRTPLRVLVALYTKWQSRRSRYSQGSLGIICFFTRQFFFSPLFWSARYILKSSRHVIKLLDPRGGSMLNFSLESVYYSRATLCDHLSYFPEHQTSSSNQQTQTSRKWPPLAGNRSQT